ncbi:B12-binding domain-containing radical SAM protein [Clostridium chauvoei]|uniref:B12-binding domain-containing radical SAM protein n=2 Tax=Clostridium chauvoei TaxID=46867 RepID=A0ABD4RFG7_9CLOT|nr:B12-binding domain-containing radical SAM protein [Clostridium chauvoei]ATD55646.1 B12-binding domain-containing radical SAM protein [Clostridium chauvoei]ATD56676.1 B12-binding domain-containing radical SAM protein [Clostridium chauvoei]MBX7280116.1 B12-binding domain-containing radical SAM protein [Clostridium chauvoei]MBX7282600.1 B12-binding domain-containing radical SAM protein [Clostridium chauvoei]MBX7285007.1 B12-binding domain-containing radical SAM protein [Clostridium chauvoei]
MKILLTAINSKFIHSNLAVRYLRAFTKDMDYNCQIREFSINDRDEKILEEIIKEKPNVVAFSTYIWNIEMIKRLSNLIKLVDDNIEILYGGPEVSYDSQNILKELNGEYIIEGEGEKTYREFVEYKLGKRDIDSVRGLYFKKDGIVVANGKRPLMNMNDIMFPYEEEENLDNKIVYYEASRGCPFNCKYCLSSTIHGVRFLDIDRVKKELQFFIDKEVRLVKFVDRTFNCNHKFAMAIWEFLINQDTKTQFHFEISADILKNEELELLKKAPKDRFQFEVGVQTTNDEVLTRINRFVNFSDIKEKVLELLSIKNIKQHLDLIAGLPGEDFKSFKKSFNDVYNINPEEVQLGFLKLLRGSSMREEAEEYGMKYSPYPPYEILKTKNISYYEILELKKVEEMVDKYYNSQKFNNIIKYLVVKFETPFDFYQSLGSFFDKKGYFNKNIGNNEYYKVFLDFNMEILKEDNSILMDLAKYDYLNFNKRRGMPAFFERGLDKEEEQAIKEKIREKYLLKNYHVESFSINIDKFMHNGKVINEKTYYLFGHEGDIINITEEIY